MNWGIPVDDLLVRTINQSTNPITLQRRADAHKVNKLMKLNPGAISRRNAPLNTFPIGTGMMY